MDVNKLEVQLELGAFNARYVQKVVDEPGFQLDVAANHFKVFACFGSVSSSSSQPTERSTGVSGVRSSWLESTARNLSLARLALLGGRLGRAGLRCATFDKHDQFALPGSQPGPVQRRYGRAGGRQCHGCHARRKPLVR